MKKIFDWLSEDRNFRWLQLVVDLAICIVGIAWLSVLLKVLHLVWFQ